MADAVKITGVSTGDIVKVSGVPKGSIIKVGTATIPAGVATRWMAGGRLGYVYTTTASNGLNGWGDGPGTDGAGGRGGFIIDIGSGQTNSITYGESTDDPPVPRWMVGFELKSGPKGNTTFINSSSAHDGAGLPYYATASNWTSGSVPYGNNYVSNGQIGFGNATWVRGGVKMADGDDFRNIGRSTNGGALWTMLDTSNDKPTGDDSCRAVAYEGGTSGNWLAIIQSNVWKSTNDGATWTDLGNLTAVNGGGTSNYDWYSMAYDGVGRWVIVGAYGDGFTSIVPIADMVSGTVPHGDWDEISTQLNTAQNQRGIVYMKGSVNKWISVGNNGVIKTTAFTASARGPGDSWDTPSTPDTTEMCDIATDHVTAIAVGASGRIWSSTDASSWTAADRDDNIGTEALNCIACDIIGAGKVND